MKPFRWSHEKNQQLRQQRSVSFEAVVVAIESGGLLDVLAHPNPERYPGQNVLVVLIQDYVYLVPYVDGGDHLVLKTVIPSRKATRQYLRSPAP